MNVNAFFFCYQYVTIYLPIGYRNESIKVYKIKILGILSYKFSQTGDRIMLEFKVRSENIEITDAMSEYIEKRISRLERYLNTEASYIARVNVRSYKEGTFKTEVTIQLPYLLLRAEDTQTDMYQTVDFVSDKLERQIRKYKTKVNRKSREKGYKGLENTDFMAVDPAAAIEEPEPEDDGLEIVRTKHVDLKPMDVEEAVLQMELLGHEFFIFQDAETDLPAVVYKRRDGKYALLDTVN